MKNTTIPEEVWKRKIIDKNNPANSLHFMTLFFSKELYHVYLGVPFYDITVTDYIVKTLQELRSNYE